MVDCYFCHRPVTPSREQEEALRNGEIIGVCHVGEFVAATARPSSTSDEARALRAKPSLSGYGLMHGTYSSKSRLLRIRKEVVEALAGLEEWSWPGDGDLARAATRPQAQALGPDLQMQGLL